MHLPLASLVSMSVIFCLLPSSSIVILVFYLLIFYRHQWTACVRTVSVNIVHWLDASSYTPVNNLITVISPVESLGYIFCRWVTVCLALRICEQFFSESQNASPLDAEPDHILTQNNHSRSFNVICFGVNEEQLRGYIVQYNICGLESSWMRRFIRYRERNKRKSPFTTTPLTFDPLSMEPPRIST